MATSRPKAYVKNGINRIILATDGDFNVGVSDTTPQIPRRRKRKSGISSAPRLRHRQLTRSHDGTDRRRRRRQLATSTAKKKPKVLRHQLHLHPLATVAQDVKIQVEFNPAAVKEYRLVGYTNRTLRNEDFNNDKADAGDIGSTTA